MELFPTLQCPSQYQSSHKLPIPDHCTMSSTSSSTEKEASLPPFSLTAPQFDLSSFTGRLRFFCDITNPLTLLAGNEEIQQAKKLLQLVRACEDKAVDLSDLKASPAVNSQLWQARGVVESSLHPSSGIITLTHPLTSCTYPSTTYRPSFFHCESSSPHSTSLSHFLFFYR